MKCTEPRFIDSRCGRPLVELEIPRGEQLACSLGCRVCRRKRGQHGHERPRRNRGVIGLEAHHVHHRHPAAGAEHLGDARPSRRVGPIPADGIPERIVLGSQVVVRRRNEALGRVVGVRLLEDRQVAGPFVASVTRNRDETARIGANWRNAHGLPADVAGDIRPDHVLARNVAVAARSTKLRPRLCLVHAQRRHVRCATRLHPRGSHGIREVPHGILVHDRPVARVLERDPAGCLALYGNRFRDGAHRFPRALVLILRWVRGVGPVDVQVLAVGLEDGKSPRAMIVVADRDTGDHGLTASDHIPAWRVQVHEIPERGSRQTAVWIIGHQRAAAEGALAAHHPVVAPDVPPMIPSRVVVSDGIEDGNTPRIRGVAAECRLDVRGLKTHWCAERVVQREDRGIERCAVDGGIQIELRCRPRMEPLEFLEERRAMVRHEPAVIQLIVDVAEQTLMPGDHDVSCPSPGRDAKHAELGGDERWVPGGLVHERIHALDERTDDGRAMWMIVRQLGGQVAAELEQPCAAIPLQLPAPDHLRHGTGGLASPHLELECPIARRGIPLREKEVVFVLRVNVRHTPTVAQDLNGLRESCNAQCVGARRLSGRCHRQRGEEHRYERASRA